MNIYGSSIDSLKVVYIYILSLFSTFFKWVFDSRNNPNGLPVVLVFFSELS